MITVRITEAGRKILAELADIGTEISLVEIRAGHPTPCSFILVNGLTGSRTLINRKASGGNLRLDTRQLRRLSPKFLLFDGHEPKASLQALERFPGVPSLLDAGSLREGTAALAGKVTYLVASEKFAQQTCGWDLRSGKRARRAAVARLRQLYSHVVVITLGERGLIGDVGAGYFEMPALRVKTVDTTGAGDVFHGALAYALRRRFEFMAALSWASVAAALSVQRFGGRPSIPKLSEVKQAWRPQWKQ